MFVCLFFHPISQNQMTVRITELDTVMVHHESWKPIYFGGQKDQKSRSRGTKTLPAWVIALFVGAGFFSLTLTLTSPVIKADVVVVCLLFRYHTKRENLLVVLASQMVAASWQLRSLHRPNSGKRYTTNRTEGDSLLFWSDEANASVSVSPENSNRLKLSLLMTSCMYVSWKETERETETWSHRWPVLRDFSRDRTTQSKAAAHRSFNAFIVVLLTSIDVAALRAIPTGVHCAFFASNTPVYRELLNRIQAADTIRYDYLRALKI